MVSASDYTLTIPADSIGSDRWRADRRSNELYMVPLASGLIAGEAIVAVVVPLLVVLGIVH